MRRLIRAPLGLALMGSLLATPACVGNQEAVIVLRAIPLAVNEDGSCTSDPANETQLAGGRVDVSFDTGYTAAFAVLNNLTQTGTMGTNSGIEASEMKLTEAIVELSFPGNSSLEGAVEAQESTLLRYSAPLATVSWDGGDIVGPFVKIPPASLAAIRTQMQSQGVTEAQMTMSVVFRAQRSSNSGVGKSGIVESRSFEFPIDVCFGCLRACQPTAIMDEDAMETQICDAASCESTAVWAGGACGNAQDGATSPPCCAGGDDAETQAFYCG